MGAQRQVRSPVSTRSGRRPRTSADVDGARQQVAWPARQVVADLDRLPAGSTPEPAGDLVHAVLGQLEREEPARGEVAWRLVHDLARGVESVRAGEERLLRLERAHILGQVVPFAGRDVGRVRDHDFEALLRADGPEPRAGKEPDAERKRLLSRIADEEGQLTAIYKPSDTKTEEAGTQVEIEIYKLQVSIQITLRVEANILNRAHGVDTH